MTRKNIILGLLVVLCVFGVFFIGKLYQNSRSGAGPDDPGGENGSSTGKKSSFVITVAGDFGKNIHTDKVLQKIRDINPDFQLSLGDFGYAEVRSETEWCDYVHQIIGDKIPFQLISGNHESNGQNGLIDNYAKCAPNKIDKIVGVYGKEYYFDYPESEPFARIILISPELNFIDGKTYSYVPGTSNFNWLTNAIDDARGNGMTWIIVGMHKDCIYPGRALCAMNPQLMNFLIQKKVDLVLQAHAHIYMRMKQLSCVNSNQHGVLYDEACVIPNALGNIYKKEKGPTFVTVGAAGQTIRLFDKLADSYNYMAKGMYRDVDASFGLLKLDVTKQQIRGEFVPAESGQFKDSFVIKP